MNIQEIEEKKSQINRTIGELRASRQLRLESLAEYLSTQGPPDEMTEDLKSHLWLIANCTTEIAWKTAERNELNDLRRELRKPHRLRTHYAHNVVIGQETDDNGEVQANYLYCEDCDIDIVSEEVTK